MEFNSFKGWNNCKYRYSNIRQLLNILKGVVDCSTIKTGDFNKSFRPKTHTENIFFLCAHGIFPPNLSLILCQVIFQPQCYITKNKLQGEF